MRIRRTVKLTIELDKDAEPVFVDVLGARDAQAVADNIHAILLAEFEWNNEYTNDWRRLKNPEWFVYPARQENAK